MLSRPTIYRPDAAVGIEIATRARIIGRWSVPELLSRMLHESRK